VEGACGRPSLCCHGVTGLVVLILLGGLLLIVLSPSAGSGTALGNQVDTGSQQQPLHKSPAPPPAPSSNNTGDGKGEIGEDSKGKEMRLPLIMPKGNRAAKGVTLLCFGPIRVPKGAKSIQAFRPTVNMGVVHHLVVFVTSTKRVPELATVSPALDASWAQCWRRSSSIIYSWARTGQEKTGVDNFVLPSKFGFPVGQGEEENQWLFLNMHYQNQDGPSEGTPDSSGVEIQFSPEPPQSPVRVKWLHTERINIPPNTLRHEVCTRCSVSQGGQVLGFRNHAHRMARSVWSDIIP